MSKSQEYFRRRYMRERPAGAPGLLIGVETESHLKRIHVFCEEACRERYAMSPLVVTLACSDVERPARVHDRCHACGRYLWWRTKEDYERVERDPEQP